MRRANNGAVKTRGQAEYINSFSSGRNKELINGLGAKIAHTLSLKLNTLNREKTRVKTSSSDYFFIGLVYDRSTLIIYMSRVLVKI